MVSVETSPYVTEVIAMAANDAPKNILQVLRTGQSKMKSERYAAIAKTFWRFGPIFSFLRHSFSSRQQYLGCDVFPIFLDDGRILNLKQIENGESNGLGTGATLWPAACVLSKYLDLHYKDRLPSMRVCDIGGCFTLFFHFRLNN